MPNITIECDKCQKTHKFSNGDFELEEVDRDERQMGAEVTYESILEVSCNCGNDIEITYHYWEYPEGTFNDEEITIKGGTKI